MKRNKSPGSDGFSSEFFKVFCNKLGPFIVRCLNYGYSTGELSITQCAVTYMTEISLIVTLINQITYLPT